MAGGLEQAAEEAEGVGGVLHGEEERGEEEAGAAVACGEGEGGGQDDEGVGGGDREVGEEERGREEGRDPADGDEDRVQRRRLMLEFKADRRLTQHRLRLVEGMHRQCAARLRGCF